MRALNEMNEFQREAYEDGKRIGFATSWSRIDSERVPNEYLEYSNYWVSGLEYAAGEADDYRGDDGGRGAYERDD